MPLTSWETGMSCSDSTAHWITLLRNGDPRAAQHLWEGYFRRLVHLARDRLRGLPRRAADEEDVALSAFASFCRGAERGRFPRLDDRDDLWKVLVVITARKALDLVARERRLKRGGGAVRGDSALPGPADGPGAGRGLEEVVGPEPTPDFAAQVAEQYQRLLARLGDDTLRSVAVWKMEGHTTDEVAARLGCSPATVARKLKLIRHTLAAEAPP